MSLRNLANFSQAGLYAEEAEYRLGRKITAEFLQVVSSVLLHDNYSESSVLSVWFSQTTMEVLPTLTGSYKNSESSSEPGGPEVRLSVHGLSTQGQQQEVFSDQEILSSPGVWVCV